LNDAPFFVYRIGIPEGMSFLIIVCIKLEYSAFTFNPEDTVLRFFRIFKRARLHYITFDLSPDIAIFLSMKKNE